MVPWGMTCPYSPLKNGPVSLARPDIAFQAQRENGTKMDCIALASFTHAAAAPFAHGLAHNGIPTHGIHPPWFARLLSNSNPTGPWFRLAIRESTQNTDQDVTIADGNGKDYQEKRAAC
jgi:hypothetical protein